MDVLLSVLIALVILIIAFNFTVKRGGKNVPDFNYKNMLYINENDDLEKRFVNLSNTLNTRDIGGYETQSGYKVKRNLVYRTDRLTFLDNMDLEKLKSLKIKTSIDLREDSSFEKKANHLPLGVNYVHAPIFKKPEIKMYKSLLFKRASLQSDIQSGYIEQIENKAVEYGRVLEIISKKENLPLMYNCTSGKDRTGIVTALLLSVLGVDEKTIVEDYTLSNYNFEEIFKKFNEEYSKAMKKFKINQKDFLCLSGVDPKWIEGVLEYIKENYVSVECYLITKAGLSKDTIDSIRYNLLER